MIPRRGLLAGLGALLAAPAIIRTPGLLMPVRPVRMPDLDDAIRRRIAAAWADDMKEGVALAIADMNRERLRQMRMSLGRYWLDRDLTDMALGRS